MKNIYDFLNIDTISLSNENKIYNHSYMPRYKLIQDVLNKKNIPEKLRKNKILTKLRSWNEQKTQISSGTRAELIQEYRDDILRLQDLIQRDLSQWLQ